MKNRTKRVSRLFTLFSLILALFIASAGTASLSQADVTLNGAGATFPFPLYMKWFSDFGAKSKTKVNYQSVGSGAGISQFSQHTVDFGATDSPMKTEAIEKLGEPAFHIPTALGAVVITYNLPELKTPLKLSGEVIANIYLGKINKWNDKAISDLNAGAKLPATDIKPVYRADGSGTTGVFTDYLAKVSADFKSTIGQGNAVQWPVGIGAKGNEGVTATASQLPGSFAYTELTYALSNKLPVAQVKNLAGEFATPTTDTIAKAADEYLKSLKPDAAELKDFRMSITNSPGKGTYPIASFTYLLVYQNQSGEKGKALVDLLKWVLTEGQKSSSGLHYGPLPASLQKLALDKVGTIQVK